MTTYQILVEWADKQPNILTERRKETKSRVGRERQLNNVVNKYVKYFDGLDYQRLTVTRM